MTSGPFFLSPGGWKCWLCSWWGKGWQTPGKNLQEKHSKNVGGSHCSPLLFFLMKNKYLLLVYCKTFLAKTCINIQNFSVRRSAEVWHNFKFGETSECTQTCDTTEQNMAWSAELHWVALSTLSTGFRNAVTPDLDKINFTDLRLQQIYQYAKRAEHVTFRDPLQSSFVLFKASTVFLINYGYAILS